MNITSDIKTGGIKREYRYIKTVAILTARVNISGIRGTNSSIEDLRHYLEVGLHPHVMIQNTPYDNATSVCIYNINLSDIHKICNFFEMELSLYIKKPTERNLISSRFLDSTVELDRKLTEREHSCDVERLINESLDNKRTGYSRYTRRGFLYGGIRL